ncbi:uncharacterized protein BXZ73DRAFT_99483 [Epithele typhae]|uniref:uncharacterized protein n=1 Tax=Epithele typhae TaxID=378194 RepID=UPI00200855D1|nr:uncharacterized protein BXZ73DRAFT_99483 [Epithele typhae]KAH9939279.1 hypothetical protein BXZ73DRAFT_99483 [Epithele typhae]
MVAGLLPSTWVTQAPLLHPHAFVLLPAESHPFELFKVTQTCSNTLTYPAVLSVASLVVLALQLASRTTLARRLSTKFSGCDVPQEEESCVEGQSPVARVGGTVIFSFKLARFFSTLALLGFSIAGLATSKPDLGQEGSLRAYWAGVGLTGTYAYASLLAFASVLSRPSLNRLFTGHLVFVLLVIWCVYVYRDLWPLATFTLVPADAAEGALLWAKLGLLSFAAVFVPLFIPHQYVPVDPKNPAQDVNTEQTVSYASFLVYTFMGNLIWKAHRVPHLPYEELPPQADYDRIEHLVTRASPELDPFQVKKRRHLFFGFMKIFRMDYVAVVILRLIEIGSTFASPIAIYQLLNYLETGGVGAVVRPWVWILWLFLGPVVGSLAFQLYIFIQTRNLVRTEAIITQLVFDHALRIRIKADTADESPAPSRATTAPQTPDTASLGEENSGSEEEDERTARASTVSEASTAVTQNDDKKGEAKPAAKSADAGNLVGMINNLVTTDATNIVEGRDFLKLIIFAPAEAIVSMTFLYTLLGWSALVGLASIILLFPLPGYLAARLQKVSREKMKKTDARVQNVTETMGVLRMVKLFGWEPRVADRLADKREDELTWLRNFKILELLNRNVNFIIPVITMILTYSTYTLVMGEVLTASHDFAHSSCIVFDSLRGLMMMTFMYMPRVVQAKVSLDRVGNFLYDTELLDGFANKDAASAEVVVPPNTAIESDKIGIRNAAFTWSGDNDGTITPGATRRSFVLKIDEEVTFRRGKTNLIVGPTGSGKTSLLMAMLGELHYIPHGPDSYVSLPRAGGIAFAAQESWVLNETVKENILFGSPYDEERYNQVIYQCALRRDLSLFDAGDMTEVGEKGLTLSGGQKARITLARAVYSKADILLLDDILAALDVHTARWIVDKCLKGDLLKGRTVILVTHNVAMASPIADYVVSLSTDGRVSGQGTLSKVIAKNDELSKELAQEEAELKKTEDTVDTAEFEAEVATKADGKLIVAEEIAVGHVSWSALFLYLGSMGGGHAILFWFTALFMLVLVETMTVLQTYWLGYWSTQYEGHDPSEVSVVYYLAIYTLLLAVAVISMTVCYTVYMFGILRASRILHKTLVQSVFRATLRWLDRTPISRVLARCTQDISSIDSAFPSLLITVLQITTSMLTKFIAVVYFSPIFIIPGIAISAVGGWCGQLYIHAQLSVKRQMSTAKAPVLGNFGSAISGLPSIRAYGAQEQFRAELYRRVDKYVRVARTYYNLNRWVSIRIDALGAAFASGLAAYLVYGRATHAGNIGFSLNMAVGFSSMILWWIRILNEFEVNGNSVERIQQYLTIEHEPEPASDGVPPAYWPASGSLRVEKLSARYSADGPRVLHEISFEVKSGERVGIVGRTGSGKSSLTLALLRLILTEGKVYYDGIATNSINLDALRSNITIIPQVPELLSGTLRQNLDPFSQYDDSVLNDALRAAGLFSLQAETDEGRITLDSAVSSGGSNLSVGQRQILALARAIIRQSKLLILDEATSAIDYQTDEVIQKSLREELGADVTLLTIAHRLQTIMDADKILVLDAGRIVEFGSPSELLKNEQGKLRALVDESGDKEKLYEMAFKASKST